MDFQGLDAKETLIRDAQEIQNQREYYAQKRCITQERVRRLIEKEIEIQKRQQKYALPIYFDLNYAANEEDDLNKEPQPKKLPSTSELIAKYAAPDCELDLKFGRPVADAIPCVQPVDILARLFRTEKKPYNVEKANREFEQWQANVKERKLKMLAEDEERVNEAKRLANVKKENLVMDIGEEDFQNYFKDDYAAILDTFSNLSAVYKKKEYPKTLGDVNVLKQQLDKIKLQFREQEFIKKRYPGNVDNLSATQYNQFFNSNETIDDTDKMVQKSMDDGVPSIRPTENAIVTQTCLTRDEWLTDLMPARKSYANNRLKMVNNTSSTSPNENNFVLFKPKPYIFHPIEESPIKSEILNGKKQDNTLSNPIDLKLPKIKKPKYEHIKKFNLTGYLFGTGNYETEARNTSHSTVARSRKAKCENIAMRRKMLEELKLERRMKALGVEIPQKLKLSSVDLTDKSEPDDDGSNSDWVPVGTDTRRLDLINAQYRQMATDNNAMPSTIKHWQSFGKPHLYPMKNDTIFSPNLQTEKTNYTRLFNVRHHHHHRDNAQHKTVRVKFLPKILDNQIE